MIDKLEALRLVLARAVRAPLAWGEFDCCLMPADHVRLVRGVDPGAPWRGRYRTALGCARLLKREGGVPAVMAKGAALAGLEPTISPVAGDVGVVLVIDLSGCRAWAGAVRTARGWAVLGVNGLIVAPASFVVAWSV